MECHVQYFRESDRIAVNAILYIEISDLLKEVVTESVWNRPKLLKLITPQSPPATHHRAARPEVRLPTDQEMVYIEVDVDPKGTLGCCSRVVQALKAECVVFLGLFPGLERG